MRKMRFALRDPWAEVCKNPASLNARQRFIDAMWKYGDVKLAGYLELLGKKPQQESDVRQKAERSLGRVYAVNYWRELLEFPEGCIVDMLRVHSGFPVGLALPAEHFFTHAEELCQMLPLLHLEIYSGSHLNDNRSLRFELLRMSQLRQLQSLSLACCGLTGQHLSVLTDNLSGSKLKVLNLSSNRLDLQDFQELCDRMPGLLRVNPQYNPADIDPRWSRDPLPVYKEPTQNLVGLAGEFPGCKWLEYLFRAPCETFWTQASECEELE